MNAKQDVNTVLNKLVAFAQDELMLDSLDADYALNRLCALLGVKPSKLDADYGDATLAELLAELKALAPDADETAVTDILMPLPHTVNYYFADELGRNAKKAFEFIFELFGKTGAASGEDGFIRYVKAPADRSVFLPIGGDELMYTPVALGDLVARAACPDIMSEDIAARLASFADRYGYTMAKRIGDDGEYFCCDKTALPLAPVKTALKDGAVKVALLDYPAPALSVVGPKNSAAREAARIIKAAAGENIPCVCAASKTGEWTALYVVFASEIATGETIVGSDALTPLGVAATVDFSPLVPVLKKGTALSSDLFAFKSVYSSIGGVKHGEKAEAALDGAVAKELKKAIQAAASVTEEKAVELGKAD